MVKWIVFEAKHIYKSVPIHEYYLASIGLFFHFRGQMVGFRAPTASLIEPSIDLRGPYQGSQLTGSPSGWRLTVALRDHLVYHKRRGPSVCTCGPLIGLTWPFMCWLMNQTNTMPSSHVKAHDNSMLRSLRLTRAELRSPANLRCLRISPLPRSNFWTTRRSTKHEAAIKSSQGGDSNAISKFS